MKLAIGSPNILTPDLNRGLLLDWARVADQAGFHAISTIDRPVHDAWEPLTVLAAIASVTERARLATTLLQLPNRNEVLVAKQAAVIDRLSGGRLDLGLGLGWDEADYKLLGGRWAKRGAKLERQVRKIRRIWRAAKRTNADQAQPGPPPMQKPLPPIWLGGAAPAAVARAIAIGDGYVFGARGAAHVAQEAPGIRARAAEAGRKAFPLASLAYFAIGDDETSALERGSRSLRRYYGAPPDQDMRGRLHAGTIEEIAQAVKEYEQAGLDVLYLFPTIPDIKQVALVAEQVLPAYRVPAH